MSRWFRFYDEALNDPKVQLLSGETFKAWVNLLCLASKSGGEIRSLEDAAFALRATSQKTAAVVTELAQVGLLDKIEGRYFAPHNWGGRQFKSDVSNERVKQHRERKRNAECNVTSNDSETPPDTEAETESEQNRERARARELPQDWKPSETTVEFAKSIGLTDADIRSDIGKFCDHFRAKGEKRVDWDAQFSKWSRDTAEMKGRVPPGPPESAKVFIRQDDPRFERWRVHLGKPISGPGSLPIINGGWYFDAAEPPDDDPIPGFLRRTA